MRLQPQHRPSATAMSPQQGRSVAPELPLDRRQQLLHQRIAPGSVVVAVGIDRVTARTIAVEIKGDRGDGIQYRPESGCASRVTVIVSAISGHVDQEREFPARLLVV